MASKKFEKGSSEWKMFSEYWILCQKFWIPEDNDEYWDQLLREADKFYKKYRGINEVFISKITFGFIEIIKSECEKLKNK